MSDGSHRSQSKIWQSEDWHRFSDLPPQSGTYEIMMRARFIKGDSFYVPAWETEIRGERSSHLGWRHPRFAGRRGVDRIDQ